MNSDILQLEREITRNETTLERLRVYRDFLLASGFGDTNATFTYNEKEITFYAPDFDFFRKTFGFDGWIRRNNGSSISWFKTIDSVTIELYNVEPAPEVPLVVLPSAWPLTLTDVQ